MEDHDLRFLVLDNSHPVSKLEAGESLRWVSMDCILEGCGINGGEPQTASDPPLPSLSSSMPHRSDAAIPKVDPEIGQGPLLQRGGSQGEVGLASCLEGYKDGSTAAAVGASRQIEIVVASKPLQEFSRLRPLMPRILPLLKRLRCVLLEGYLIS